MTTDTSIYNSKCKVIVYIAQHQDNKRQGTEVSCGNSVRMYDKTAVDFQQPSV